MKNKTFLLALMAGSSFLCAAPAFAQDGDAADVAAEPQALSPEESAAKAAFLEAQVQSLQEQIDELKGQLTKATPSWKGMPQWEDKDAGWSFKPRGRIQWDAAYIENPDDNILTRNLGFNTRARRIRLGAEGTVPGGFGYKFEMDFANSSVGFGDVIMTYAPKGKPWSLAIGNHETFQSLEQITSSRFTSFIERAQMNDAFGHARRIGLSVGLVDKTGAARLNAGIFAAHSIDGSFDNDGWIAAARATYAPQVMGGQLHVGANIQHREFQSNNGANANTSSGAPSTNQLGRYRARPFLQTTDVRFVDTGSFAAKSDDIYGFEIAGIFKSLHFAGEAQWASVNSYDPGDMASGLDAFGATNIALTPSEDPTFFSWYAELGYFLTGESRGYKNGAWDRTKVLNPFSKGGWGAFQVNARYDYLDLMDGGLKTAFSNNFATGVATASNNLGRGGTQRGYLASLIWIPEDYVRFILQLAHTSVKGGPQAGVVEPTSSEPLDERSYSSNSVGLRAQIDF